VKSLVADQTSTDRLACPVIAIAAMSERDRRPIANSARGLPFIEELKLNDGISNFENLMAY
jgi:hypothetical protein